ncbi:MotA/TolQ/ExbB proton channel family protein [Pistricoccus aurantiacus]|uniref:MotA/TolQ/ExbB proton channel family protein n=1 Tax=Pistricoccus aurantiacus TaxID=1883414 RepID=UPI0036417925
MSRRMRHGAMIVVGALVATLMVLPAQAQDGQSTIETLQADRQADLARDNQRLAALVEDPEALEKALEEAQSEFADVQERRQALEKRKETQQERQNTLADRRDEQGSDLDAVRDVLINQSSELRDSLHDSWLTLGGPELPPRLAEKDGVLEPDQLETLADRLMLLTAATGEGVRLQAFVADHSGERSRQDVIRLGDFLAFSDGELLRRQGEDDRLMVSERTPAKARKILSAFQQGETNQVVLDPTKGKVIDALAQQPTLMERFHQGGAVGYVVVALGALGLLVALGQYLYLLKVTFALRRQRKHMQVLKDDNPLGRVLKRFRNLSREHAPEALEARLDEALLAEMPRLERGQALVKLLAAIAPLLGLLGTVTGMIVTFQSITVFGTGDPQLMAGGISQALVTTVLGLITAVPLLFAHTALTSRSRHLVGVLEGQASAVLAERLMQENAPQPEPCHEPVVA